MQLKALTLALAGAAVGQEMMDLTGLLAATPSLSNLTSYLGMFPELLNTLGGLTNITVLAPSNEAFTAYLNTPSGMGLANAPAEDVQAILTYHVLNGSYPGFDEITFAPTALMMGPYANVTGGQVVEAMPDDDDNLNFISGLLQESMYTGTTANFTGGVVHIIDTVLTLPYNVSTTAVELNLTSAAGALIAAELVDTVQSLSDITMFVPNNDAFQRIGSALPNLTIEQITSILTYHVVEGTVGYSTLLEDGMSLTTVEGTDITVTINDGDVYVNSAMVTVPNVLVANGVVHVINGVLNPMNATATPDGDNNDSNDGAFDGASSVSDSPFTSGVPSPTLYPANPTSAGDAAATTSAEEAGAPMVTGAMGAAALFGGAAMLLNV